MEDAREMALRLMAEVSDASKPNYSRGEVKTLLNRIGQNHKITPDETPEGTCRAPTQVDRVHRGDVFVAKAIGGKVRPWIVLRVRGDIVSAVPISSSDIAPKMIASQCRLWPGNWIGSTVALYSMELATAEVTRPYTNRAHLAEVEAEIQGNLGLCPPRVKAKKSIAEIHEGLHVKQPIKLAATE